MNNQPKSNDDSAAKPETENEPSQQVTENGPADDTNAAPKISEQKSSSVHTTPPPHDSDRKTDRQKDRDKSTPLDPRVFAFRPDLAARGLYGRVTATRYAAGETRQVCRASVALRKTPEAAQPLQTEALFGEKLTVYDEENGWAWVQLQHDRYVGYLPANCLTNKISEPTHWVRATGTFVYPEPDIKSPPLVHLSITSRLRVTGTEKEFSKLDGGGYVITRHISQLGRYKKDFVDIAERLIDTPYLWGGKTRIGIDCSGLVQVALAAAGIDAPRDSDMQQKQLGRAIDIPKDFDGLHRGDLIFWKGHVAIMLDSVMMVHATAHAMSTVVEPLPEASERITKTTGEITAIRRLADYAV
jgi:cell wall-associated NlpC family hydrolase